MGIGKFSRLALGAILAGAVSNAAPGASDPGPPEVLTGGAWNVHYADNSCRLTREFGEGDAKIGVRFEWFGLEDKFDLQLSGKQFATKEFRPDVNLRFGPVSAEAPDTSALSGKLADGTPSLIAMWMRLDNLELAKAIDGDEVVDTRPKVTPEQEAAVRELRIAFGAKRIALWLGSMRQPMQAVHMCQNQLLAMWGLDPVEQRALVSRPVPIKAGSWVTSNDYPSAALRANQQALIHFRVKVGADGKPTDCVLQSQTSAAGFGTTTCMSVMRRSRFNPALRSDGSAVESYYATSALYMIPN